MKAKRMTKSDRIFETVNTILLVIIILIEIYPLLFTVVASVSDPYSVVNGEVFLLPKGFTLDAYKFAFDEPRIWRGYRNTIFYTVFGTLWNLLLTIPAAYVLSKKDLVGRKVLATYFLIPMYFSGGLIPTYLQMKAMNVMNSIWTLVILGGISIYNLVVSRVYFETTIPNDIYESARIDGASDFRQFFAIALPLAAPILAVMALYYGVGHWNDYFNALIYVSSSKLQPLQMELRSILLLNQNAIAAVGDLDDAAEIAELARRTYIAEAMKYALIFISCAPMLIAYPFVQKYFVKGMMIGSLKG